VRRIVDAAALPDLLGRETAASLLEASIADGTVVYVQLAGGDVRVVATADGKRRPGARWRDRQPTQSYGRAPSSSSRSDGMRRVRGSDSSHRRGRSDTRSCDGCG